MPTPWGKQSYDSAEVAWQEERYLLNQTIFSLSQKGAANKEIEAAKAHLNERSAQRKAEVDTYLESNELSGKVGAFEGAGYMSTGMYRPSLNCIMFSHANYFCPVCEDAMIKVIESYSE